MGCTILKRGKKKALKENEHGGFNSFKYMHPLFCTLFYV
jgi:hypothetical protein